jgi:hypothetical protein
MYSLLLLFCYPVDTPVWAVCNLVAAVFDPAAYIPVYSPVVAVCTIAVCIPAVLVAVFVVAVCYYVRCNYFVHTPEDSYAAGDFYRFEGCAAPSD